MRFLPVSTVVRPVSLLLHGCLSRSASLSSGLNRMVSTSPRATDESPTAASAFVSRQAFFILLHSYASHYFLTHIQLYVVVYTCSTSSQYTTALLPVGATPLIKKKYLHFFIRILVSPLLCEQYTSLAKKFLTYFAYQLGKIYVVHHLIYNVHTFIHTILIVSCRKLSRET